MPIFKFDAYFHYLVLKDEFFVCMYICVFFSGCHFVIYMGLFLFWVSFCVVCLYNSRKYIVQLNGSLCVFLVYK